MTIIQKTTPNKKKGRGGLKPIAVVIHITDGYNTHGGTDGWFANPKSKVSAHYLVQRDGAIHQYVDEHDTAIHAGIVIRPSWSLIQKNVSPNAYTIGIEHEGKDGDALTPQQAQASAELIAGICRRWSISIDADHVIPHHAIRSTKTCPGSGVNISELISLARKV